jgi:hypothetical protein
MIIRIISEIKEDTYKHLNQFKGNAQEQLTEIRKTMESMKKQKRHRNPENQIEILKMKSSKTQKCNWKLFQLTRSNQRQNISM